MVTFAEYYALELQNNRTALKCTSCFRRKLPTEFRKTPWHGRAAACSFCEGLRHIDMHYERQRWLLEQERETSRALRRHLQRVKAQRDGMARVMTSGELLTYRERPIQVAISQRSEELRAFFTKVAEALEEMG